MPHDRRRAERNGVARLLDAPAKIDVVARLMVFRIEPADVFKRPAIPGHVTAGDMLGYSVGEKHMARPPGCRRDTGLDPVLRRGRNVWSPYPGVIATQQ